MNRGSAPAWLRWLFLLPSIIPTVFGLLLAWVSVERALGDPTVYPGEYLVWGSVALATFLVPLVALFHLLAAFAAFRLFEGAWRWVSVTVFVSPLFLLAGFYLFAASSTDGVGQYIATVMAIAYVAVMPLAMVWGIVLFIRAGRR